MPVGISVRGEPPAVRRAPQEQQPEPAQSWSTSREPEPELEPEPEVQPPEDQPRPTQRRSVARGEDLDHSLLAGHDVEQGPDDGREPADDEPQPPSPVDRLRASAARRRDSGAARMHAVQNSLANGLVDAIGGGPQSRYLFALWLALLMMFLFGFIFLLVVNINQWTGAGQTDGVILNDGGNTDSPVGHCNPETSEPQPGVGGCDCYADSSAGFVDEWIDAQVLGEGHVLGDDDFFTMRLPFPFTFYGKEFKDDDQIIMVSSNGYFTFGAEHYKYGNTQTIPHDGVPDEMVAVYWSDFDPSAGLAEPIPRVFTFYRQGVERLRQRAAFVVEWAQIAHFGSPSSTCTFEAILYEGGYISLLYQEVTPTPNKWAAPSVGFEDARGKAGVQIAFNDPNWPKHPRFAQTIPPSCHSAEVSAENHTAPATTAASASPHGKPSAAANSVSTTADDCGLSPCVDRDPTYCPIAPLSGWCQESFGPFPRQGSMTLEDITLNPKLRGQYATELCPVACDACEADAARQRAEISEAYEQTKVLCSASMAHDKACGEWEDCYVVGLDGCQATECQCKPNLARDDCGVCSIPPALLAPVPTIVPIEQHYIPPGQDQAVQEDVSSRYPGVPQWNADIDCAGECHGAAEIDQCGSCAGGITTKELDSMLGCDGKCFSSKQCPVILWSPIIMLASATCIGFTMVVLVTTMRRRLVRHILAERTGQQGANRQRHVERTDELMRALPTVLFQDLEKERVLQELGLPEDAELYNCSICLAEYEVRTIQRTPF
jgi:hypothetical protein